VESDFQRIASSVRTAAGLSSFLPVAVGAVGAGILNREKRSGINFFTSRWPRLVLSIGGVELDVVGRENLLSTRPAVFIFNHRNNYDVFVAAALVSDNWTAVGKKELENHPVAGSIGRIVDAAFIDRDNLEGALERLQKVEDLARKGLSVIIAPEGTRVDTSAVGSFKKGAFRIAMSAQIPIIPLVIRNAESAASHSSMILRPSVIEVAVLPPLSVAGWTIDDLPTRIADVRDLYVKTLSNWPRSG
jgi:1-acyl-sn-glycerol-3-phosphate acyltransferase